MTKGKWIYGKDQREEKHYFIGPENDLACTVDIADVMTEEDAQAISALPDLVEALQYSFSLIRLARQYFPKSIKNQVVGQFDFLSTCYA